MTVTTTTLTCGGYSIIEATIVLTRVGAWYADVRVDATAAPARGTATSIKSDDGSLVMNGTVAFSGVWQGHVDIRVEGGGGGVDTIIAARAYQSPTLGIVLNDALRDAGETLDPSVNPTLLATSLPAWTRRKSTLASVLGDLVRYACLPLTRWRILANGNLWIGQDTFTTTVTVDDFELMDLEPAELQVTLGSDFPAPALIPGVLFAYSPDLPAGRVSQVEHVFGEQSTRTTLWLDDPATGDRLWSPLSRVMGQLQSQLRFAGTYTGTVTSQASDGSLSVLLDDPTATAGSTPQPVPGYTGAARMPSLAGVPIRTFGPQVVVKVAAGTRVLVSFAGGSPAYPEVVGFDGTGTTLTEIDIGPSPLKVARVTDPVRVGLLQALAPSGGGLCTMQFTPLDADGTPGAPVTGASVTVTGVISNAGGATTLKAG